MLEAVQTRKLKYDGTAKPGWTGFALDRRDGWITVFFPDPPPWKGRPDGTHFAATFYGLNVPLSVLAILDDSGRVLGFQCDAGLPATEDSGTVTFVDLELDVMADANHNHYLRDEDDFALNRQRMAYPPDVVAAAWDGVRLAEQLIEEHAYPFDGTAERLLEAYRQEASYQNSDVD